MGTGDEIFETGSLGPMAKACRRSVLIFILAWHVLIADLAFGVNLGVNLGDNLSEMSRRGSVEHIVCWLGRTDRGCQAVT